MIGKEITKHLSTEVDIQSDKFYEAFKRCYMAYPRTTAANPRLAEKIIWENEYIEPVTREAFPVSFDYGQQIVSDDSFEKAFYGSPYGTEYKVEWDAVAHFTELDDYKNCYVEMVNFRINAILD